MAIKPIDKLSLNDEVTKYYDEILKKSETLFCQKEYQKAIDILQEELDQPYMPFEYEEVFEKKLNDLEGEYKLLQLDNSLTSLSQAQMLAKIFSQSFNPYLFDFYIQKFHQSLTDNDYFVLQNALQNTVLTNAQKFYVLDALAHFEINKDFVFYNATNKNDAVLNTLTFHQHQDFKPYNTALEYIEKALFKEPTLAKFCIDLLNEIASEYFPEFPFTSSEKLAEIIINTINNSFNYIEPDFAKLTNEEKLVYKVLLNLQLNENS